MKIFSWEEFCDHSPFRGNSASVTLGVFDGIHSGHRKLMEELTLNPSHLPLVFTFRMNPAEVTSSKTFMGNILTLDQKLERMQNLGVKGAVIIDFSHDFSKLTGTEFFSLIMNRVELKKVVLGENHRLGNKGETGASEARKFLEKQGVCVKIIESMEAGGEIISSTRIRELLLCGKLKTAAELLGFDYTLDLKNIPREKTGRFLRIKNTDCHQILPPAGEYDAEVELNQEFIATKLVLDDRYIRWNQNSDIPAKNIIFRYSD